MDQQSNAPSPSLREALRRARAASAERSGVLVELRTAELARLDLLKEQLESLFKEVPQGVDLFDAAILPGDPARLFVDVLGFVEMGRDKRTYRFFHDTRYGRKLLFESQKLPAITQAITDYVAHRIVEREKALVSDLIETGTVTASVPTATVKAEEAYEPKGSLLLLVLLALIAGFLAYWGAGALWDAAR
jgi:hypothetical protein